MLTDQQKEKLQQLTTDCPFPKLKRILEEAIPRYISGEVKPVRDLFGIYSNDDNIYKAIYPINQCCLLGAAAIGKVEKDYNSILDNIQKEFGLSDIEYVNIILGFDSIIGNFEPGSMAEYVHKVAKVLFGVFDAPLE